MKHAVIRVLSIAFILAAGVDLARRGWTALALEPWLVSMIAWPVLFFTVALLLAIAYALVLLSDARAAIASRMSPTPTSEEVPHGNESNP